MKKYYSLISLCLLSVIFLACSKDILRSYDKRVIGSWKLFDIDRYGIGRSNNLPFKQDGIFTFYDDGKLTYKIDTITYKGSWDIRIERDDEEDVRTLHITVADFVNQQLLTEYFNDMTFTGTNRFNGMIADNSRTYIFRFQRQ